MELIATTGSTPCALTFSSCLRRLAAPIMTSSGFSASIASGSGRPATTRYLPECDFRARTVATTTAASGFRPETRHLMLKNRSAPMSAPNPASVTRKSPVWMPIRSATTLELPCAMLPNGPDVHEHRSVLQRLEQVRLQRLPHDHGHRARRLELLGGHRLAGLRVADDDPAQPGPHVLQRPRQREDRHRLGRGGDVETRLPRDPVPGGAKADHDVAQRPVVDVEHPLPGDLVQVDAELVAHVQVVVQHRGELVVRRGDRVHVAGQVQVQQLERHRLAVAAAGRAALDAERRAHRRLADRDRGPPADVPERLAEADRGGGLALAERGRRDRGDDDVLGRGLVGELFDGLEVDLGDVLAVQFGQPRGDADVLSDLRDRF